MKNSKQYWGIFILVAILVGMTILLAGGFFDKNGDIDEENKTVTIVKKNINLQKNNTKDDNDIEQLKKVDLADSDIDFESDYLDFNDDNLDDIKNLDEDLDFGSVNSEVY